jgi:hypothetical protein
VPAGPTDRPVDAIVTETGIVWIAEASAAEASAEGIEEER